MTALLYTIFFASGASALIFEMLWFRQAGLALGSSVWASSLVLSGFMAGLALGNAAGARHGARIGNPVRAYAIAELAIAITGMALVHLLPILGAGLAPVLRPLLDHPWVLNPLRLAIAFVLLLIPSTAMGITLPLLTRAITREDFPFGAALGRLYGWNTLGAVAGVVASEMYLVGAFGVRGTALVAGALNLLAAAVAMRLSTRIFAEPARAAEKTRQPANRRVNSQLPTPTSQQSLPPAEEILAVGSWRLGVGGAARRWLVAAFLAGFCLLALEIVWFRLLLLFVKGHSVALALILGIILGGIALGGLAAASWLRFAPGAHRFASAIAFAAGVACASSYAAFPRFIESMPSLVVDAPRILEVGAPLMLPVSFLSGLLFTVLGAALRGHLTSEPETAGVLTLVNTAGAACGSLAAGFVLLPALGMERSLFLLAIVYGGIGVLLLQGRATPRATTYVGLALLLVSLALFPFGAMETRLIEAAARPWRPADADTRVVTVREGLSETVIYFQRVMLGRPISSAMLTNSFSMSATGYGARRYMKLYVYWPMAVHPDLKRVLLIGYGVGNTAKAMTDSTSLDTIDVVDRSRDILEMARVVYPGEDDLPLNDPRVRVHVEDGRYLLQTTDRVFDLITGEPPPPGIAGVESLYTREYFQLMRGRLAEGGIVTYWLPLSDLSDVGAKAILAAFCQVFEDCSLWNGSGTHLMMVGTRNRRAPVAEEAFTRQWRDRLVAAEMQRLGLERPEQLAALFIGDAAFVADLIGEVPPLTDNYPKRIEAPSSFPDEPDRLLRRVADTGAARTRFQASALIRRLWPERLLAASVPYFEFQDAINAHMYGNLLARPTANAIEEVHGLLTRSLLREPVIWRLGSNADIQRVVDTATPDELANPLLQFHLGVRLIADRRYAAAAESFGRAAELTPPAAAPGSASTGDNAFALQIYALCMAGELREAQELIRAPWLESLRQRGLDASAAANTSLPPFWVWMKERFGIDPRIDASTYR